MPSYLKVLLRYYFGSGTTRLRYHINLMYFFKKKGMAFLVRYMQVKIESRFSCYISPESQIDDSVEFRHPTGIVIGDGVRISGKVIVYQGVTIGGARLGDMSKKNYPIILDNVVLFAGAKILGGVTIGKNSVVGANAVVLNDVPDGCLAVGVPAKFLNRSDYE